MTSKAERITQAVYTALTTPAMSSVPASSVYRDLTDALASESWPAILVETGDEEAPERVTIGHKSRRVEIRVTVLEAGGYSNADAALVESFDRLAADPSLGGLAFEFEEGPTLRSREGASESVVSIVKSYVYQFRTTELSLES